MRMQSIWDQMTRMQQEMDELFENFWPGRMRSNLLLDGPKNDLVEYSRPATDFYETEKEYILEADMPGIQKEDIQINVKDNVLEMKAEKKHETKMEEKKKGTYRMERSYYGFYRNITLPENANSEQVDAEYKNGVLHIKIPKKQIKDIKTKLIKVK